MAKELRLRRGNASETASFVGADSEVTVNSDNKSIHVHDGTTSGGFEAARADLLNVSDADFSAKATSAGVGTGNGTSTSGADANATFLIVGTDTWGLPNERRIQVGDGVLAADGGSGGGYTISAKLANATSGPPSNLGAAGFGSSTFVARADHVHAMPTALDVGAVSNNRVLKVGTGLAISNSGVLDSNATVSLAATLNDLSNVELTAPANNDLLLFDFATSKWKNFTSNTLGRMTVKDEGVTIGTANAITTINFVGNGVTTTTDGNNNSVKVTVPYIYGQEEIEDFVGAMVSGNVETGINVTYDDTNGKLNFATNNFDITLTGDVQGTATVSNLQNISLNTVIAANSIALGADTTGNYVGTVTAQASNNGVIVTGAAGEGTAVEVGFDLNNGNFIEGVQDIVGGMVSGNTENGINVTYVDATGKMNFDVDDFSITLTGPITGTGTVTNLGNVSFGTAIAADAITLGTHTAGNYVASLVAGSNGITITGSGGEGSTPTIGFNLADANFVEGLQDVVGSMVSSNTESGINVTYDDPTGKLNFDVGDFTLSLSGPINGSATVTNLANATLTTSLAADAVTLGTHTTGDYVATLGVAGSNGITITGSGEGAAATVGFDLKNTNYVESVQDIVGTMVTANTESGITVTYDDPAGILNFDVDDFSITLTGPITGSGTVTNLGNVSFATTIAADAVTLGTHTSGNYIATLASAGNGVTITGSGSEGGAATVGINMGDANFVEGVQDIIGTMVTSNTESGIAVTYNDGANKLDFDVNDFTLTLSGPVTGSATVASLANATLTTVLAADSVALGTHTTGNYVGTVAAGTNGISVTNGTGEGLGATIDLDLGNANFIEGVQDVVGTMVTGNTESGIAVTYDDGSGKLNFDVADFTLTLGGDLTGSVAINNLGSATLTASLAADSVELGTDTTGNYVASVGAGSNGVTITGSGEGAAVTVDVDLSNGAFVEGVQDLVGTMVTGNTEAGIAVTYDDVGGKLNFDTNDFSITLTGDVTGTGTVTNLGNVSFATTIAPNSIALGTDTTGSYVSTVAPAPTSYGIAVTGSGSETAAVELSLNMGDTNFIEGVQDIIGGMVGTNSEAGIAVTYDDTNGKLDFDVNDFSMTLSGVVTGSATVSDLTNTTVVTTLAANAVTLGTHTTGSYVATVAGGGAITASGGTGEGAAISLGLDTADVNFVEGVQDIIGTMVTSNTEAGIAVTYDDTNGKLNFDTNDFTITLTGDVTGTGTVTNLGNVSFATTIGLNSVALGTDTTGDYVGTLSAGTGISVTNGTGEGGAATVAVNTNDTNLIEAIQDHVATMFSNGTHSDVTVTYNDGGIGTGTLSVAVDTSNLDATTLDGYDSSAFPRKSEAAIITGGWKMRQASDSGQTEAGAALTLETPNGERNIQFIPWAATGTENGAVQGGDAVISAETPTALTLVVDTAGTAGLRVTTAGVEVVGTLTRGGNTVLDTLNGFPRATTHQSTYSVNTLTPGISTGDASLVGEGLTGYHILTSARSYSANHRIQLAIADTNNNFRVRNSTTSSWNSWNTVWTAANDGSGSSLDADLLDGLHGSAYLRANASDTFNPSQLAGEKLTYYMENAKAVTTSTDNGSPLQISQLATGGGDAYMTFLTNGTAGAHFGMDRTTADLFVGGWTMGTAKNRIWHDGNTHVTVEPLRANFSITGGGKVTFNQSAYLTWSQRFIYISFGGRTAASGYWDITCPTSGTITGVGGAANKTATASGIPLETWEALYYILPLNAGSTSSVSNFRVVDYHSDFDIPANWIRIASYNGDNGTMYVTGVPYSLAPGDSYDPAAKAWGTSWTPDANNTRNIGTASLRYNTIYATTFNGTATSAQYADLAERYEADAEYQPGTVVVYGGEKEITTSTSSADRRVAGVISTAPGYMMNSEAGSDRTHPYVALVGRVPCRVVGPVQKGDMLVTSSVPGCAMADDNPSLGTVIGKALEDHVGGEGVIEIAVQRH